jgi:glycosyltransferase involved in cell wall biosynthesis
MLREAPMSHALLAIPFSEAAAMVRQRSRILCFVPSLGGGGAEMHLLRLLTCFNREEFEPVLAVGRCGGSYEARLPTDVSVHQCAWHRLPSAMLRMESAIPRLCRLLVRERPAAVLAFIDHAVAAVARALARIPGPRPIFIAGIQNNLEMTLRHLPFWIRGSLGPHILQAYAQADHVIALSKGIADMLLEFVPQVRHRTSVIYNAGYDHEVERLACEEPSLSTPARSWLLGCGRLTAQKDFSTLLRAFARIKNDFNGELWILGEGELRAKLERERATLGLSDRVCLPGFVQNPFTFMARATTFILSSRWEGFGNVITEAMACGTPVIATDCPHGPREILEGGKWGELVPVGNVTALAEAMRSSMLEAGRFRKRADAARDYVRCFESTRITREYEKTIHSVLAAAIPRLRYET